MISTDYTEWLGKTVTTIYGDTAMIIGIHVYYSMKNGGGYEC